MKKIAIILISLLILAVILTAGCTSNDAISITGEARDNLDTIVHSDAMLKFLQINTSTQSIYDIKIEYSDYKTIHTNYFIINNPVNGSMQGEVALVSACGMMPDDFSYQIRYFTYGTSEYEYLDVFDFSANPCTLTYNNGTVTIDEDAWNTYVFILYDPKKEAIIYIS